MHNRNKRLKNKQEYIEKLKDLRWQKMRLQVFERDEWACQICLDTKSTLHVHHKYYLNHRMVEPWEYPMNALITLCAACHQNETEDLSCKAHYLICMIKKHFLSNEIEEIAYGFRDMNLLHTRGVVAGAISHAISNEEIQRFLINIYCDHLKKQRETREANRERPLKLIE